MLSRSSPGEATANPVDIESPRRWLYDVSLTVSFKATTNASEKSFWKSLLVNRRKT
jgi:hypothetical protein